jgi:hypothetical protein
MKIPREGDLLPGVVKLTIRQPGLMPPRPGLTWISLRMLQKKTLDALPG